MDYLTIGLLLIAAGALLFFGCRFRQILPQMERSEKQTIKLQDELRLSQAESQELRKELQATRSENKKLQSELQKTRTSLDSCTTALNQ